MKKLITYKWLIASILACCVTSVGFSQVPVSPIPDEPPVCNLPPQPSPNPGPAPQSLPGSQPYAPAGWGCMGCLENPPSADWMNRGTLNVMATGYDSQGVLKQIPLVVSYSFNGATYNVTVVNAWNPYTESWNLNVDCPAYSTSHYMNGFTYNYYAPLALGTFYFNL